MRNEKSRSPWSIAGLIVVGMILGSFGMAVPAQGELCARCRGAKVDSRVGVCVSCGDPTASRDFKLCKLCSRRQKRCQRCLASLEAAADDGGGDFHLAEPARPINPERSASVTADKWSYQLLRSAKGDQREGELRFDNRPLQGQKRYQYMLTPWGPLYWVGKQPCMQGVRGWTFQPPPVTKGAKELLMPPGSPAKPTALTRHDDRSTLEVPQHRPIVVILRGNPTTGYRWQVDKLTGNALRQIGDSKYYPRPHAPGWVGGGGTFVFLFEAVHPGTTTGYLVYARPWEKNADPNDTFQFTVEVDDP